MSMSEEEILQYTISILLGNINFNYHKIFMYHPVFLRSAMNCSLNLFSVYHEFCFVVQNYFQARWHNPHTGHLLQAPSTHTKTQTQTHTHTHTHTHTFSLSISDPLIESYTPENRLHQVCITDKYQWSL